MIVVVEQFMGIMGELEYIKLIYDNCPCTNVWLFMKHIFYGLVLWKLPKQVTVYGYVWVLISSTVGEF